MCKLKSILLLFFLMLLSVTLFGLDNSQEKKESPPVQKKNSTASQLDEKETSIQEKRKEFIQEDKTSDNTQPNYEEMFLKSQRNLDRSIAVLNVVASSMAALVGLITIVVIIGIALGFFEFKKWEEIRKRAEQATAKAEESATLIRNIEKEVLAKRKEIEKMGAFTITEKPPEKYKEKLDELTRKIDLLEALGWSLNPDDYFNRGNDLYYKNKFDLAIEAYSKAIELKPDYAEAWDNKGVALSKLGRHQDAFQAFNKAIELKPDYAEAWYNKSVVLGKLGRHQEALEACNKAIELKPDDAEAWYNKASLFSLMGDRKQALIFLSKAVELDKAYKEEAKTDEDFRSLWEDEEFKKIII